MHVCKIDSRYYATMNGKLITNFMRNVFRFLRLCHEIFGGKKMQNTLEFSALLLKMKFSLSTYTDTDPPSSLTVQTSEKNTVI